MQQCGLAFKEEKLVVPCSGRERFCEKEMCTACKQHCIEQGGHECEWWALCWM